MKFTPWLHSDVTMSLPGPDLLLHFPGVSPQMVWLHCTGDYHGPEHQTGQMQMPLVSILVSAELCCGALRLMFPVFSNNLHWQGQENVKGRSQM